MNTRYDALRQKYTDMRTRATVINDLAVAEDRDLTDDEQTELDELHARAAEMQPLVEKEYENAKSMSKLAELFATAPATDAVATRATGADVSVPQRTFSLIRKAAGVADDRDELRLRAITTSTSPGLYPYVVTDDLIRFADVKRRVIESVGNYAQMPNALSWNVLVETGTATVGTHTEGASDIVTGNSAIAAVNITPTTIAGKVNMTMESLSIFEPSAEQVWTAALAREYARYTDAFVASAMSTGSTNTQALNSATATALTWTNAILTAANTVQSNAKDDADTIWVSASVRLLLANLAISSSSYEPAFPFLNPVNRDGQLGGANTFSGMSIAGLPVVVCPNFTGGKVIVGNSKYAWVWESDLPTISAYNTTNYTKDVVIAGRIGTYFRPEGFVKLTDNSATPVFS